MNEIHPGWHILLTEPRRERAAQSGLSAYGIKAYLPELPPRRKLHGRKVREIVDPMFPGYIFTPAQDVNWLRIRMTQGIVSSRPYLSLNGRPAVVAHAILEVIEGRVAELQQIARNRRGHQFKPGDLVKVSDRDHPFWGLIGSIERFNGKHRVRVLLSLFGSEAPTVIREEQLEVA